MTLTMFLFFSFLFAPQQTDVPASIYEFKATAIDGSAIDFAAFKGKKIMIVNTATLCGHAPQFQQLEDIYKKYKGKLVVVAFPANNFLFQEPRSNEKIAEFCQRNYGVTFPVSEKISVKGRTIAPLYQWLTKKQYNNYKDSKVKWNFQKYLIDEKGALIAIFDPQTLPNSPEVIAAIEQ
jgi:glutathione peroxidase